MTDVFTVGERKATAKCNQRILLSAIPKKMSLSGRERGEIVKIYCMNGQNAAQTLRVYRKNHGFQRGPCTVKVVRTHEYEETGCTCDRLRSGRTSVPVETVAEVHQTISTVRPASARVFHVF